MAPEAGAPPRIRWREGRYSAESGHAGTLRSPLFGLHYRTRRSEPEWTLTTKLPGMDHRQAQDDDLATLRLLAETWLAEFVASLGAVFPEEG